MNHPTASATTWSMTATGRLPRPSVNIADLEYEAICEALRRHDGHRGRAAAELGIGVRTLGMKIRALGLPAKGAGGKRVDDQTKPLQPTPQGQSALAAKWKPKVCEGCGREYQPTGGKQQFCRECRPKPAKYDPEQECFLDRAPDSCEHLPSWCATAPWSVVESTWVAAVVEQFGVEGNMARLALALSHVRNRYRAESSKQAGG